MLKILNLASFWKQGLEMTVLIVWGFVCSEILLCDISLHFNFKLGFDKQTTCSWLDSIYLRIHLEQKYAFHPSPGCNQSDTSGSSLIGNLGEMQTIAMWICPSNLMGTRIFIISLKRCLSRTDRYRRDKYTPLASTVSVTLWPLSAWAQVQQISLTDCIASTPH